MSLRNANDFDFSPQMHDYHQQRTNGVFGFRLRVRANSRLYHLYVDEQGVSGLGDGGDETNITFRAQFAHRIQHNRTVNG